MEIRYFVFDMSTDAIQVVKHGPEGKMIPIPTSMKPTQSVKHKATDEKKMGSQWQTLGREFVLTLEKKETAGSEAVVIATN